MLIIATLAVHLSKRDGKIMLNVKCFVLSNMSQNTPD